jgi:hypothetical protein
VDWKQYVSVAALLFSLVSFSLTFSLSRTSAMTSVRRLLVFEYTGDEGWSVRNVWKRSRLKRPCCDEERRLRLG